MKLIEDLGTREYGSQGKVKRFGLYECPVCHEHFECRVDNVNSGHTTKCRNCANVISNNLRATKVAKEFIKRAQCIHGAVYKYNLVDYKDSHTNIEIGCAVHGIFKQRPDVHLLGRGCPHCSAYGFDKNKPAIVYYLKVAYSSTIVYKIGITNRSVNERFNNEDLGRITILKIWEYGIGADAYDVEQQILKQHKEYKYLGEPILSSGNTELFTIDVLQLDGI